MYLFVLILEDDADIEGIEAQWNKLLTLKYSEICDEDWWLSIDEKDTSRFWIDVYNIKDSCGKRAFPDLAIFTLEVLSLPLANANTVERVFSVMNAVKTKSRNRMAMMTLEAILRIRLHLNVSFVFIYHYYLDSTYYCHIIN